MGADRRDTPSGPHQAVSKNGKDRLQDKELRDLAEQNQRHHDEFIAFTKQDLGSHVALDKTIQGVKTTLDKYTFTGKVLWSIAGLLWTALVAAAGWMASEVGSMDDAIRDQGAKQSRIEAQDAALKGEIGDLKQDLRDLRRLVQEHQINKREHNSQKEHE